MSNKDKERPSIEDYKNYVNESKSLMHEFSQSQRETIIKHVDKLNDKFMQAEFVTPDDIYIDLALLKDINLGVIFTMLMNHPDKEKLFDHIKKNIPAYQLRFYDDPLLYFTELDITRDEFLEFKADPKNHEMIYTLAPFTLFHIVLLHNLKQNVVQSQITQAFTKEIVHRTAYDTIYRKNYRAITYYINTYPLKLSEHSVKNLQTLIGDKFGVNVVMLNEPLVKMSYKFLLKLDEINAYKLDDLLSNKLFNRELAKFKFAGKYVYTPLLSQSEIGCRTESELKDEIALITSTTQMTCFFKWLEAARYAITLEPYDIPIDSEEEDEQLRERDIPSLAY